MVGEERAQVPGGLGALLREQGPLAPRTAVQVVALVADALADAHRAGEVHGDLHPDDVVVHPPLLDVESDVPDGSRVGLRGMVASMDPTARDPDRESDDVRDTGRLLWACLTGQEHEGDATVPRVEGSDAFTRGLNWVLARSTSPDPAKRHRDAAALRADLLTLVGGRVGAAAPAAVVPARDAIADSTELTPAEEPAPDRGRRGPRAAVLLPVLAVLLVVGLVVAVVGFTRDGSGDDTGGDSSADTGPGGSGASGGSDGGTGSGAVTGDVDGDGRGDVVLVQRNDDRPATLATYVADGAGGADGEGGDAGLLRLDEQEHGDAPAPLIGDLDGDGVAELTTWDEGPGDGDLVLEGPAGTSLVAGAGPRAAPIVGDYDGDGVDDLAFLTEPAAGEEGAGVRVAFPGSGDASAAEAWASLPDADPTRDYLVPGDLDGDGDDDLVLVRRDPEAGSIDLVPLVAEDGAFTPGTAAAPLAGAADDIFRGADPDGDGVDDVLLVPLVGGGEVRSFVLDGERLVPGEPRGTLPGTDADAVRTAGVTDVDGDGRDDLALVRVLDGDTESRLEVLRSDGTTFADPTGIDLEPATGRVDAKIADGSVHRPFLPGSG